MKQIGYLNSALVGWFTKPQTVIGGVNTELYVAEQPLENINADHYQNVGWILPGDRNNNGGIVYEGMGQAGRNSVPVYTKRPEDPMNVTRSEFDTLAANVGNLNEWSIKANDRLAALESICRPDLVTRGVFSEGAARRAVIDREVTEAHRMTFYDHAFIAAWIADKDNPFWDGRSNRAHQVAKFMTEARRPKPDA